MEGELSKRFFAEKWQRSASRSVYCGIQVSKREGHQACASPFLSVVLLDAGSGRLGLAPSLSRKLPGSERRPTPWKELFYGQKRSTGMCSFTLVNHEVYMLCSYGCVCRGSSSMLSRNGTASRRRAMSLLYKNIQMLLRYIALTLMTPGNICEVASAAPSLPLRG